MDLDILLPFHRFDPFLVAAIDSLKNSRGVNLNVIAIDDRPDQKTDVSHVFASLENFKILNTSGGQGYGEALRIGTEAVESSFIALFNSDDLVHPDRFKFQLNLLDKAELCITNMERMDYRGKKSKSLTGEISTDAYDPAFLLFGAYGANASWCAHLEWWNKYSFFDNQECLDWRIAFSSFRKSSIAFINKPMYKYRKHPNQVTANKKLQAGQMDPVFNAWQIFALDYNLKNNSRAIFDAFSTPWLNGKKLLATDTTDWLLDVSSIFQELSPDLQKNLKKIIQRRLFFAGFNSSNSNVDRLQYVVKGFPQLVPLLYEIIF